MGDEITKPRKGRERKKTPAELRWEQGQYVGRPSQHDNSCISMDVKRPPTLPKAICSVKSIENWALNSYTDIDGEETDKQQRDQNTTIQRAEEFVNGSQEEELSPSEGARQRAEAFFQEFQDRGMPSLFPSTPLQYMVGSQKPLASSGMQ